MTDQTIPPCFENRKTGAISTTQLLTCSVNANPAPSTTDGPTVFKTITLVVRSIETITLSSFFWYASYGLSTHALILSCLDYCSVLYMRAAPEVCSDATTGANYTSYCGRI